MNTIAKKKARPLFAHAARCDLDGQGRILLPQNLRDFAGLTKDVTIVGCGETAEFWDSDEWKKTDTLEVTPENIKQVFMDLDF